MNTLYEKQKAFCAQIDTQYSYTLAKQMENFRTNAVLGYRTAGSRAEFKTGEMLLEEMNKIGLCDVNKDAFTLDTWEFDHARLFFTDTLGKAHKFELGGYQTNFSNSREYEIVSAGKGTAEELSNLDVNGKLVLVEINQRDDWWISYPVYQAHLHGAAAVLAVQTSGYGNVDTAALNAQNICGPADAPAFSISQDDAEILRKYISACNGTALVHFDAKSVVEFDGLSYNITGTIPGTDNTSMILISAHYDSYFSGFQDDNAAVALMLGIARALITSNYQPIHTIVFCAMAAEEWGISNTKYDWSTGAYSQIFRVHPEWVGHVIANINFELPAYPHEARDAIRCVYEYSTFLQNFTSTLPDVTHLYPDGVSVVSPVMTWSDDFSMAIAGVPSLVNDFAGGSFMETHYHSQFDNDDAYDEEIYKFHHVLYGSLLLALDFCAIAPLDFSTRLQALRDSLDDNRIAKCSIDTKELLSVISNAQEKSYLLYRRVEEQNRIYNDAIVSKNYKLATSIMDSCKSLNSALLLAFKYCEDSFVRLTWHDDVIFPHEYEQQNLSALEGALNALHSGDINSALEHQISNVDTNFYACFFEEAVCRHFVDYVIDQPHERLMWGDGRICGLVDLFATVKSLLQKRDSHMNDFDNEIESIQTAYDTLSAMLDSCLQYEVDSVRHLMLLLDNALKT